MQLWSVNIFSVPVSHCLLWAELGMLTDCQPWILHRPFPVPGMEALCLAVPAELTDQELSTASRILLLT